ncbi:hypothetical protein ATANTOWER_008651 [Ataeniobius toweri]|uniref:Uncharacterized protein n=1 Tax=Ataeniobius toweri TaxID=208326 RepID=A0ABU7ANK1_9TELE|nr:hypothetical protein [Ataeniobius toweri]
MRKNEIIIAIGSFRNGNRCRLFWISYEAENGLIFYFYQCLDRPAHSSPKLKAIRQMSLSGKPKTWKLGGEDYTDWIVSTKSSLTSFDFFCLAPLVVPATW